MSLSSLQPQVSGRVVEARKAEVKMEVVGAMVEVVALVMGGWEN